MPVEEEDMRRAPVEHLVNPMREQLKKFLMKETKMYGTNEFCFVQPNACIREIRREN
jgi:hypothetical protein